MQYQPERLPRAAERAFGEGNLRAAADVARRVHCASAATGATDPETRAQRAELNRQLRYLEEFDLRDWAGQTGLLLSAEEFNRKWHAAGAGDLDGAEHQIHPENGFWHKRNDLIFHGTWLEYFHRLALHDWLFPDTAYRFEGLMDVDGKLWAVSTQKSVLAERGATRTEVEREMNLMEFDRVSGENYYNSRLGVLVEDLHDENAVITQRGSVVIFDPVIYLAKPEMGLPMPVVE